MGAFDALKPRQDKVTAHMREVLAAAEEFIHAAGHETGDKLAEARRKFDDIARRARHELEDAEDIVVAKTRAAAASTDTYVHAHPWTATGIGAAVGLLVGLLICNRR